ncbi:MAG: tetratricopeptide repeat protein [Terriglobales bacterium]
MDANGDPVPEIMVQLWTMSGTPVGSQLSDGLGRFMFVVTTPGPYEATMSSLRGTEQVMVSGNSLQRIVIRVPGTMPPRGAAGAGDTVSLNDLEAPDKAKAKLASATKAIKKSNFARAWKLVNDAIRMAPDWGKAYLLRGVLSFTQHNYNSARADFATAVAHDPHDGLALTELGKLYSTTGQLALSGIYLRRALQIEPVRWPTYYEMAVLEMKEHKYAQAETLADKAVQCQPAPPASIHFLAALAAYHVHQLQESSWQFQLFLKQAPKTKELAAARSEARRDLAVLAKMEQQH